MSFWDLRREYPALETDRTAERSYSPARWLTEARPVAEFDSDWLIVAFGTSTAPAQMSGKFKARRLA
jgi:hypothetical protein